LDNKTYKPIISSGWTDYELLDSGNMRKLERFGSVTLDRYEPEASWKPAMNSGQWQAKHKYITTHPNKDGQWSPNKKLHEDWNISLDSLQIALRISKSRHIGIFPEQVENWRWLEHTIQNFEKPIQVLNLFAYSGVASLYCARAGAQVTHVDASRVGIDLAKQSQEMSGLQTKPIRWIIDDAIKFTEKELRRGNRYQGIILDPPLFGRGPKGEIWKFEKDLEKLLALIGKLFAGENRFFLLTAYNIQVELEQLAEWVTTKTADGQAEIQYGPLIQMEKSAQRQIAQAVYVRWASLDKE